MKPTTAAAVLAPLLTLGAIGTALASSSSETPDPTPTLPAVQVDVDTAEDTDGIGEAPVADQVPLGPDAEIVSPDPHQDLPPGPDDVDQIDDVVDGDDPEVPPLPEPVRPEEPGNPVPPSAVDDIISGGGTPPPPPHPMGPDDLLGELDDSWPVPEGLDLAIPQGPPVTTPGLAGPGSLTAPASCANSCISRGVALPRGFGARLEVETTVAATLFLTAIADLDGDGDYEESHLETTDFLGTEYAWNLDHLEPGTTYHVMVAATDANDHTDYAWGEFTTLSNRDIFVDLGDLTVSGGPGNIAKTSWLLGLNGPLANVTPGEQGILAYKDVARTLDVDFWVVRRWNADLCEGWSAEESAAQGHDADSCLAWNSNSVDVDLDTDPGQATWTSTTAHTTVTQPAGDGQALPPGYGDPYWFDFEVPITFHVSYS